jgi:hypothetical protein
MCRGFDMTFYVYTLTSNDEHSLKTCYRARKLLESELDNFEGISGFAFIKMDTGILPIYMENLGDFSRRPSDKQIQYHIPMESNYKNHFYGPIETLVRSIVLFPVNHEDIQPYIIVNDDWLFTMDSGYKIVQNYPFLSAYMMTAYTAACPCDSGVDVYHMNSLTNDIHHKAYYMSKDSLNGFWQWFVHLLDIIEVYQSNIRYLARNRRVNIATMSISELVELKTSWEKTKHQTLELHKEYAMMVKVN